jgi:hypothetical protein
LAKTHLKLVDAPVVGLEEEESQLVQQALHRFSRLEKQKLILLNYRAPPKFMPFFLKGL